MVRVLERSVFTLQFKPNNNDSLCLCDSIFSPLSLGLQVLLDTRVWLYFFFIFSVHRFLSFSQCATLQFKFKTTLLDFLLVNCLSQKEQKNSFIRVIEIFKGEKSLAPVFQRRIPLKGGCSHGNRL